MRGPNGIKPPFLASRTAKPFGPFSSLAALKLLIESFSSRLKNKTFLFHLECCRLQRKVPQIPSWLKHEIKIKINLRTNFYK